jgi:hypothetical protein
VKQCDAFIGEQNMASMSHARTFECRMRARNENGANTGTSLTE